MWFQRIFGGFLTKDVFFFVAKLRDGEKEWFMRRDGYSGLLSSKWLIFQVLNIYDMI